MPCGTAWRSCEEISCRAVLRGAGVVLQQRTSLPHPPQGHLCPGRHYSGLTSKTRLAEVLVGMQEDKRRPCAARHNTVKVPSFRLLKENSRTVEAS